MERVWASETLTLEDNGQTLALSPKSSGKALPLEAPCTKAEKTSVIADSEGILSHVIGFPQPSSASKAKNGLFMEDYDLLDPVDVWIKDEGDKISTHPKSS